VQNKSSLVIGNNSIVIDVNKMRSKVSLAVIEWSAYCMAYQVKVHVPSQKPY